MTSPDMYLQGFHLTSDRGEDPGGSPDSSANNSCLEASVEISVERNRGISAGIRRDLDFGGMDVRRRKRSCCKDGHEEVYRKNRAIEMKGILRRLKGTNEVCKWDLT